VLIFIYQSCDMIQGKDRRRDYPEDRIQSGRSRVPAGISAAARPTKGISEWVSVGGAEGA
jgi:hypothetical protein